MSLAASLPQAVKAELWRRGEIEWQLEEHQRKVYSAVTRNPNITIVYLDWTRRGGKTRVLASLCDFWCRQDKISVKYGAAYATDLKRFIRPTFDSIFEDCPQELRPRYIKSEGSYVYPHGSTIELVGCDKDPDKMRGNAVRIMVLDEAGFMDKLQEIYEDVVIPATARRKDQMDEQVIVFIATTPPPSAKAHYANTLRELARAEGFYSKLTLEEVDSIDDEEKARLYKGVGGRHSIKARREFGVEWIIDADRALMPTFNTETHVSAFDLPDFYSSITGGDTSGKRDLQAFHIIAYDHQRDLYLIVDEYVCEAKTPSSAWRTEVIAMEQRQRLPSSFRIVDMPHDMQRDLGAENFHVMLPEKGPGSKDATLTLVRDLFYRDKILIHPRCTVLIQTLATHLLNRTGSDFERNDVTGHADAYDSIAYSLMYLSKHNPTPAHVYGHVSTHHVSHAPVRQGMESTLNKLFNKFD